MLPESVETTLDFVAKINEGDLDGVASLLSPDHTFIDMAGDTQIGKIAMIEAWSNYLRTNPKYQIYIRRVFQTKEGVVLVGHTTGSHLNLPEDEEFHGEGVIWVSKVKDGMIKTWQLYEETPKNKIELDLLKDNEVFAPSWIAATIAKHMDLLPVESRTRDVQNVRKYYSHLFRHAPPTVMLSIGEHLFFDQGYRFVPYELIYYHPGTIEILDSERVKALGEGINSSSSADTFAHFILGPAWKVGVISDEEIQSWINSSDMWWRRAAVISTIYLGGDVQRMLKYSEMLLDDQEDLIIKALAWVLREAISYNHKAVEQFLQQHQGRLAPRIVDEVQNKLAPGLKNP